MIIENNHIEVNGILVEIVRKDIKNLHLAVYPPLGHVRIAVPLKINDEAARLAVVDKIAWVKRLQTQYQAQNRQSERDYISGESHYFMGHRFRLRLVKVEGTPYIKVYNKKYIDMFAPKSYTHSQRGQLMYSWYRHELRAILPSFIQKWEKVLDLKILDLRIKRMKTRWGSCNPYAKRIWLNLELAKKPTICLEYVIVHEMAHFFERTHNDKFIYIMDKYMPRWRLLRAELNDTLLAHEQWQYQ